MIATAKLSYGTSRYSLRVVFISLCCGCLLGLYIAYSVDLTERIVLELINSAPSYSEIRDWSQLIARISSVILTQCTCCSINWFVAIGFVERAWYQKGSKLWCMWENIECCWCYLPIPLVYSVSQKIPLRFSDIFPKRLGILVQILHAYYEWMNEYAYLYSAS